MICRHPDPLTGPLPTYAAHMHLITQKIHAAPKKGDVLTEAEDTVNTIELMLLGGYITPAS